MEIPTTTERPTMTTAITTAETKANRANTAECAKRLFEGELKNTMKAFKVYPTSTYFISLSRAMLVWQQFDQLQSKPSLHEQFNAFLDRVPSLPLGTWGDHACIFACGMTSKELLNAQ